MALWRIVVKNSGNAACKDKRQRLKKVCSSRQVLFHLYLQSGLRENDQCWHSCS